MNDEKYDRVSLRYHIVFFIVEGAYLKNGKIKFIQRKSTKKILVFFLDI